MTISFALGPDQLAVKDAARQFAQQRLRPLAAAVRAEHDPLARAQLARAPFEEAVASGFLAGLIPVQVGGAASSGVDAAIFVEEWATESPDFTISFAGPLIALTPVYEAGTPEQVGRFVAPFLVREGAPVAAMAFSEPAGSANYAAPAPAAGIETTAVVDGDHWVINGHKAWASHLPGWDGDGPDLMTIVCRTPGGVSVIVAEREHLAGHIEVEEYYDLPGLRGCLTARIRLRDVRVPLDNLIGTEGQGIELTRNAFLASGASIGTFATAAMRRTFDIAYEFARTEKRGGSVAILEHQAVADILSDAKGRIEATRLLSWRALDAVLSQAPNALELALHAKVFGSETGLDVVNRLIQAVGVSAYDNAMLLTEQLAHVLAYPIIEGSNVGMRRRQLQELLLSASYDPLSASGLS
ncbi:acyl-CoA dehydrogenase family protein [Gordonia sp. TBRC 11910]|uniref:Acyl-CoA dehydrogenase family protein n=1 Tax=Gordonia asplenii TaxID=2725283 RepID=A0A848LB87_9ACTN|nr:acyl-CoA dehydrogenase family protein [Gordonia asplenii]NMO04848.1 acyl-CoA dehydrogenase family protein [Gordonia asplenii]